MEGGIVREDVMCEGFSISCFLAEDLEGWVGGDGA